MEIYCFDTNMAAVKTIHTCWGVALDITNIDTSDHYNNSVPANISFFWLLLVLVVGTMLALCESKYK